MLNLFTHFDNLFVFLNCQLRNNGTLCANEEPWNTKVGIIVPDE